MTEDDNSEARFRAQFETRIKEVTLDTLPAFIAEMLAEPKDYGTICLAIGFAAAATAWAVEKSPQGGITGFQAGAVGWEMLRQWGSPGLGLTGTRLLNYDHLLYPQHREDFTCVSREVLDKVRERATDLLAEHSDDRASVHPDVWAHWQRVSAGEVPFGLGVSRG